MKNSKLPRRSVEPSAKQNQGLKKLRTSRSSSSLSRSDIAQLRTSRARIRSNARLAVVFEGLLASEWVILNGKAAFDALFTG
jgi:hypothetical protein